MVEVISQRKAEQAGIAGRNRYETQRGMVDLTWKSFQPREGINGLQEGNAIIFLPGWSITAHAKSINMFCQALADFPHNPTQTYAIDTRIETSTPDFLHSEVEAIRQFIQERGLTNITLIGNSLGGSKAIHLIHQLKGNNPDVHINGLILEDSASLFNQTAPQLVSHYAQDLVRTQGNLMIPSSVKGARVLRHLTNWFHDKEHVRAQNRRYFFDGLFFLVKEVAKSNIAYPRRLRNELHEITTANPHLRDVDVPVVLVQGQKDLLFPPTELIPDTKTKAGYIEDLVAREEYLQQTLFPNSPYVRMIVARRMGHHNLMYSRPQATAQAALYLQERNRNLQAA